MSKLLITTQVYENYGAHVWEGDGECPQYWKAKGGNDYVIRNIDVNRVAEIAALATAKLDHADDYFTEHVIGWDVVADDFMTAFERDQLELDGEINYPAKEITI